MKKEEYDVAIIGAGPAGLFSAYELIENDSKLKIAIFDRGSKVEKRFCPMSKNGTKCLNCNPMSYIIRLWWCGNIF
jgi:uncharacterized FAD-dependent dehydrogenase